MTSAACRSNFSGLSCTTSPDCHYSHFSTQEDWRGTSADRVQKWESDDERRVHVGRARRSHPVGQQPASGQIPHCRRGFRDPSTLENVGLSPDPFRTTRSCAIWSQLPSNREGAQYLSRARLLQRRLGLPKLHREPPHTRPQRMLG